MKVLNYFKGIIFAAITLFMDAIFLPLLDKAVAILDFLPDMIEVIYMRLKDWVERHKK